MRIEEARNCARVFFVLLSICNLQTMNLQKMELCALSDFDFSSLDFVDARD